MRRLILLTLLLPAIAAPQARSWQKLAAPGLVYRMEYDMSRPWLIHALRWSPKAGTAICRPELGGGTVMSPQEGGLGRETLPEMAARTNAVAGINADFFASNGDPVGAMISNGELISTPWPNRSAFGWGPDYAGIGQLEFNGKVVGAGKTLFLKGVNQACQPDEVVLNTAAGGRSTAAQAATVHLVLEMSGRVEPNGTVRGKVRRIVENTRSVPIQSGEAVIAASGKWIAAAKAIPLSAEVEIRTQLKGIGIDMDKVESLVGGGPVLVREGQVADRAKAEGFADDLSARRHPRSALGVTADGEVWMVVIDGRQAGLTGGATLQQTAEVLVGLGCVDGLNLDGGGSSTMVLNGVVLNRPSDLAPRPISNGMMLFYTPNRTEPIVEPGQMVIVGRPYVQMGLFSAYEVIDHEGRPIPNREIIWTASGDAWVDQGGFVRPLKPGVAKLRASVRGQILEVDLRVEGLQQTPPPSPFSLK